MASNTQPSELDDRALSFEEAERLAAQFKPSWELDDGAFGAGGLGANELEELSGGAPVALDGGALSLSSAAAAPAVSDTIIEGIPTMSIGESSPSAEPPRRTEPAAPIDVDPPPRPQPASRTQLGIGASDSAPSSRKEAPPSSRNEAPPSSRKAKPSGPRTSKPETNGSREPVSARGGRISAPSRSVASQPAEDAIDLPVTASKGMVFKVLGGVVALGVVIVAIKMFSGSSEAPAPAPSVQATTATPPAPSPTETAAVAPPPAPSPTQTAAAPPPAPSPTQTAAAAPPPSPPAAPDPPPKKAAASTPASPPPPKQAAPATPPPPKKSGGGIIRDAPF